MYPINKFYTTLGQPYSKKLLLVGGGKRHTERLSTIKV